MAEDFTAIFGNNIIVSPQPRQADRQYTGFSGAHGLVGMHMGTRGYQIVISGRLAGSGGSYSAARAALQSQINDIEAYTYPGVDAADYTFAGTTYENVVFDRFQLIPDSTGKIFHWTSAGLVMANFVCYARALV